MRIALITVGDTARLTGGYLYHARLLAGLRAAGDTVDEFSPCGAALDLQLEASAAWGERFDVARYDVVVVDALARGLVARHADDWRARKPLAVLVHQLPGEAQDGAAHERRERELEAPLLRADRLIAVSGHGRELLQARGVPVERIAVVSPGFDRLAPSQARAPRSSGPPRVLCVAQWIPRKGIVDLVAAWAQVHAPGARLELVGEIGADSGYAQQVREALSAAPPTAVVRGTLSDAELHDAYLGADLFALPTRFEGYGMVFAEALAFGLPIVACDVGPLPELLGPAAALLVAPGDVPALAGTLQRLLDDHELRGAMAAAARRRALELPSWSDTVAGFRAVLLEANDER